MRLAITPQTEGLLYGLLGVAAFSLTLPMTRLAVSGFEASQVIVWRGLIASIASMLVLAVLRPPVPVRRHWKSIAFAALGTVFGFAVFMTLGMQTVSASHGAVVVGLLPLATAIAAVLINKERPSIPFWIAAVLGTAVTLTFVLRQAEGTLSAGHGFLLLAVVLASVGYAFGGKAAKEIGGWQTTCWSLFIAFPILLVAVFFVPPLSFDAGPVPLGAFFYLALVSQFSGFFAWYRGLALAGVARVSQIQLLQLFMTVIAAVFLIGEKFDAEVVLFGALVVTIVWIGTKLRVATSKT
jgi:drug/metabolite transporter (DMT)-like permease